MLIGCNKWMEKMYKFKQIIGLLCFFALPVATCAEELELHGVVAEKVVYKGRSATRVTEVQISNADDKVAILVDSEMRDGTISGYVSGTPRKDAGQQARGFVGNAFRINDDVSAFEAFYLRPTNARAEDQLRRNHSVQYISHPDYPWYRLRKDSPGKYESYADMLPGEWVHYRIVVKGERAKLYLNHAEQPTLIVNDLKLGKGSGRVGLWIGPGTQAHFSVVGIEAQN